MFNINYVKTNDSTKDAKREVVEQYLRMCKETYEYSNKFNPLSCTTSQWYFGMKICEDILKSFDAVDLLEL